MDFEKYELNSGRGWSTIRFGDSPESVRKTLVDAGITYDDEFDDFEWIIEDLGGLIDFAADSTGKPARLVQFVFDSESMLVDGREVVGLRLDEALLELNVRSFQDTLWSMLDIVSEYTDGKPIDDAKRPTESDPLTLLESGTLWIKSLGLGLVLDRGDVEEVVLRAPTDTPRIGCGPLDKETLVLVADGELQKKFEAERDRKIQVRKAAMKRPLPMVRTVLAMIGAALLIVPIYGYVQDQIAWQKAVSLVGVVVELRPPNTPFPDVIVVEYKQADTPAGRVELPFQYTSARSLGDEVELVYRTAKPNKVLTRSQIADCGSDTPMSTLIFTIAVGLTLLTLTLPFRGRRSSRSSRSNR